VRLALAWGLVAALAGACAAPSTVSAGSSPSTGAGDPPATSPAPTLPTRLPVSAIHAALGCPAGMGVSVARRVAAPELTPASLVVAARCASGAGSPPSGVYLLEVANGSLRLAATLVASHQQVQVTSVAVRGRTVTVRGSTYSGPGVPRCCPDVPYLRSWTVTGGRPMAIR